MKVSAQEYAELRGHTKPWVSQQIDAGMPVKRLKGRKVAYEIDTATAIQWEIDRIREGSKPGSQRERLAKEQADKFELENARRRGELILSSQVAEVLSTLGADLAQRHDGLPGRLANELAGISDAAQIRERLLDELRIVRGAFADAVDKLADALGEGADAGPDKPASPKENAKRVGGRKPRAAGRKRRARAVEQ